MSEFLEILLEAKGDKKPKPKKLTVEPDDKENNDYTNEEDDTQDEETEDTDATDTEEDDTEDDNTDYTEEEEESDPEEDGEEPPADGEETDDSGDTDYTSEETPGDEDGEEPPVDDESTETDSDTTTEEAPPEEEDAAKAEQINQRILLEDFSNLYYLVKNTITKLSNIDKSNILINKIVTQISSNLNVLLKHLFDFITFTFPRGKYVTNLYKYNYFLEAFKINVEMLKKISVFMPN